jgi:hypothetical protein
VIEVANESGDRALEVNVVFPQRVIGVNEQGLAGEKLRHVFMVANRIRRAGCDQTVDIEYESLPSGANWMNFHLRTGRAGNSF